MIKHLAISTPIPDSSLRHKIDKRLHTTSTQHEDKTRKIRGTRGAREAIQALIVTEAQLQTTKLENQALIKSLRSHAKFHIT